MVAKPALRPRLIRLLSGILALLLAQQALPQPANFVLQNVVAIEVGDGNALDGDGFGLIVGRSGNLVWAATAAHLVFQPGWENEVDPVPYAAITARWTVSEGRRPVVRVVPASRTDTAFIAIDAANVPDFIAQPILDSAPVGGDRVVIAARLGGELLLDRNVGIVPAQPSSTDTYAVPGLRGIEGQSGAPVTSERGVIGLFNAHAGLTQGFVIPISAIRSAAPAEVPWMLIDNGDPNRTAFRFCVRHIGRQRPDFSLRGPRDLQLGADGCTTGGPLQYEVVVAERELFSCEPPFITPQRNIAEPLAIDCDVRIAGTWHSAAGDLIITRTSLDRWTLSGLGSSRFGPIHGGLQGMAHSSLFSGTTSLGGSITGTFEADPRRATFRLQSIDGTTQVVELNR